MSKRLGYVRALDGVRGIAIALVVACHYYRLPIDGGPLGVGLFFVLSGFLITTLLLEERDDGGRISLRRFYVRRARRLLPAVTVLLVVYLLVRALKGENGLATAALGGLYIGNLVQAFSLHDVVTGSALAHLWTLAEEEQFYAIWPIALLVVLRSRRPVMWTALITVGLSAYRATLAFHGAPVVRLYYGPDTGADWLLAGTLLALLRRRGFAVQEPFPAIAYLVILLGLFASPWTRAFEIWQAPVLVAAASIVIGAAYSRGPMAQLLTARPLVGLGKVSYSLYLWHVPVFAVLGYKHPTLALPLALAAAFASHRFVEQRFRRPAPVSVLREVQPLQAAA